MKKRITRETGEMRVIITSLFLALMMVPGISLSAATATFSTHPVLQGNDPMQAGSDADVLVIRDVSVLTMESDQISHGQTIIIRGGRIAWVGPAGEADIPEGSRIIDGDYHVMPGLAEMHAHIPSSGQGEQYMHDVLVMYLAQGITTIRGMLGEPAHLDLRVKTRNGDLPGPRIFTSGPSFNARTATHPDTVRQRVREQVEAGYDLIKLHPGISLENFNALADEAQKHGMEFSGHISYDVGLIRTLEAGQGSIDHLDRYMEFLAGDAANRPDPSIIYFGYDLTRHADTGKIDEAARLTAEAGVWNVPTNTLLVNVFDPRYTSADMRNWPGMEYVPQQMVNGWANFVDRTRAQDDYDADKAARFIEIRNKLTLSLHRNGAGLLLGADAPQIFNPPGFAVHRELALLIEAGLSPYEAISTGTVNVGTYLGEEDSTGKVKEGFRADVVLLRVNPLESIPFGQEIAGVIAAGRYYSAEQLQHMLDGVRTRAGN